MKTLLSEPNLSLIEGGFCFCEDLFWRKGSIRKGGVDMACSQIVVVNGRPGVYSWIDGFKTRREESLVEVARKSDKDLIAACNLLFKQGRDEEAEELFDRITS